MIEAACPSCGHVQRFVWRVEPKLYKCCSCYAVLAGSANCREKLGAMLIEFNLTDTGHRDGVPVNQIQSVNRMSEVRKVING